jgi:hypothetical protein
MRNRQNGKVGVFLLAVWQRMGKLWLYLRGLGAIYIKKTREAVGSHVRKVSASVAVTKYIVGLYH